MIRNFILLAVLAAAPWALVTNAAGTLPTDFADQLVVGGLNLPADLAFLPDSRILVVEQKSRNVRLVAADTLVAQASLNIPDVNTSGGERGLLGVAVDPGWPARPYAYFMFNRTPGNTMYISRFTGCGDLGDPQSPNLTFACRYDILVDIPDNASNHNAGTLRFGPDGMLYASLGEDADACAAQDSSDFRGVILRMDVDALPSGGGGPPDKSLITPGDNPYPSTDPEAGLAFCHGLRNPFRFHIDPLTGALYIGDVGQSTFEEMNEARGGENFGWPHREGDDVRVQIGCPEPGGSGSQAYDGPIGGYDRSSFTPAAIIGGPRYRVGTGPFSFPLEYDGAVFFSEYYQGFVRVITETGGVWGPLGPVSGQPSPLNWADGFSSVGDWIQGPDDALYYLQQASGELRRIVYTGVQLGFDPAPGPTPGAARPNPYRAGSGVVTLSLGEAVGPVAAEVFSVDGRRVRALAPRVGEGGRTVSWDGRDEAGRAAPSGIYLIRVRRGDEAWAARVALLR